jgi:hypothetical protein
MLLVILISILVAVNTLYWGIQKKRWLLMLIALAAFGLAVSLTVFFMSPF